MPISRSKGTLDFHLLFYMSYMALPNPASAVLAEGNGPMPEHARSMESPVALAYST